MTPPPAANEETFLRAHRFTGRMQAFGAGITVLWLVGSGRGWDWWLFALAAGAAILAIASRIPMDGMSERAARFTFGSGMVVPIVFLPVMLEQPAFMVFPAVGTTMSTALFGWRFMVATTIPPAVIYGLVLSRDVGLGPGLSEAAVYFGGWVMLGSIAIWLRGEIETGNQALLVAQAEAADRARIEVERQAEAAAQAEAELRERAELAASLHRLVEEVTAASDGVVGQSSSIASAVQQLADALDRTSTTAQEAETNVQQIASATAESQNLIGQLGEAGQQIVGIADTIADLSEQTNLLALNATIEAARAGDAGKGFAVVANEVKELAQMTAKSAFSIGEVIEQVRQRLDDSAKAMGAVAELVTGLEASQTTLSSSVTEQTAVVSGISDAADAGAQGVAQIGQVIRQLDESARQLDHSAS